MSLFSDSVLKALIGYKSILRKQLPQAACTKKMDILEIRRRHLREANEVGLFQKGMRVLREVELQIAQTNDAPAWYSGIDEFYAHLSGFLNQYSVEGGRVVHVAQRAANALVKAVQLFNLPEERLTKEVASQLVQCGRDVIEYGVKEQQEVFETALKARINHHSPFYTTLLLNYRKAQHSGSTVVG